MLKSQIRRPLRPESTAFAYVRCGVTDHWIDEFVRHDTRVLSRGSHNELVNAQWRVIRSYARREKLELRRFYDAEETTPKLHAPLPLPRRKQLAALFVRAIRLGVRTILVDDRHRFDEDEMIRSVLLSVFRAAGIRVFEARTGLELTALEFTQNAKIPDTENLRSARIVVGRWKWLVSRLRSGSQLGRKPFGSMGDEQSTVNRIRELYRILPRSRWRRRGSNLIKRRSYREIATILNQESIPTRTGREWSGTVVYGVLKRLESS